MLSSCSLRLDFRAADLAQAALEKAPLGRIVGERESRAVARGRLVVALEAPKEVGASRVEVRVAVQLLLEPVEQPEPRATSPASAIATARFNLTTGDGSISTSTS